MRHKSKLQLVRQAKADEPISSLSSEEEARLGGLADLALHNQPTQDRPVAGDRAHKEHESLKRTLTEAVDKLLEGNDDVA
jgi:hypothetical protein